MASTNRYLTSRKKSPGRRQLGRAKFGGTSVGKFAVQIAEDIVLLLRAAREAEKATSRKYVDIVEVIRLDHIACARDTIRSADILDRYTLSVNEECATLVKILESAQHLAEVSLRTEDKIVAKGEKLSCLYMTALLEDRGAKAAYVDLSDIINFDVSRGVDDEFYKHLALRLAEVVLACEDAVPVITGYFGNVPGGLLTQIGRGYTDLCAALVAVGLRASELQIWKEVNGIFTADPRKVPTARLLESVTPSEAAELTFYGSEVIHPFTMDQVIRASIPIRIKNVKNPRGQGTVVLPDALDAAIGKKPALFRNRSAQTSHSRDREARYHGPERALEKRTRAHGFLMSIFSILDKWSLSVDLISSSEVHVSMALHSEVALLSGSGPEEMKIESEALKGAVEDLNRLGDIDLVPNMAVISLIGSQLKSMIGVAGNQGASEINISCVIEASEANRALNVVHTNLFTFLEE
ncbi:hypothetical protein H2203_002561 [Taxawa tesnikishii (nom. ined.)]|nr:hypothetical protein H2203_002561 [Dothideales sp. JES 119]